MVKKVTVTLVDDLDDVPAAETVLVGLDGAWFEIDLSESNASLLRKQVGEWTSHARKLDGRSRMSPRATERGGSTQTKTRGAADRARSAAIRHWARSQGYDISARGRISSEVVQAYESVN